MDNDNRPTEILIFFDNGNKAKFRLDKVIWSHNGIQSQKYFEMYPDLVYVNWDRVCYVRKFVHERTEDD